MISKKNKIIWYVHPYAGGPGIGRYSRPYFLAKNWIQSGHEATVFSSSYHHLLDTPQAEGEILVGKVPYCFVKCPSYSGNGFGRLWNMLRFSWNFFRNSSDYLEKYGKPDVLVASSPHPYVFLATHFVAKKYRASSIFEVRDLWPLSLVELAGVSRFHPLIILTGWIERFAYKKANRVVSLLPNTFSHMAGRGISVDRWSYIPNGIEVEEAIHSDVDHECIALAKKWSLNGDVVFLYAGALGRPNHLESLIEAVNILKRRGVCGIKSIIVGRGEQAAELKRKIQDYDLSREIEMFDQIPKKSVMRLMQMVDAGYISLRPEAIFRFGISPNKLFDYMLAELPVIFAVKAGNDPVAEAGCGFSAEPGSADDVANAMHKIFSLSRFQRKEMGKKGRSYVLAHHDYASLARAYLDLIK